MVAGVSNAWKVPVIESENMDWVDLQKSNTDMQFSIWQEYLIKVACAVYKIAPDEIGFNISGASSGSAMFEGQNEHKLKYSQEKGLKPLLKSIQFWVNKWIVNPLNPDFEFVFVGMDIESEEKELSLDIQKVQNFGGWKEARKKWNMSEELEEGDFPLNQAWIQYTQGKEMMEGGEEGGYDESPQPNEEKGKDAVDKAVTSGNPLMEDLGAWWESEVMRG